jgi:hypothetical protein
MLRIIWSLSSPWLATAPMLGAMLWPEWSAGARRDVMAKAMLANMAKHGYVASSSPRGELMGVIWTLTESGADVVSRGNNPGPRAPKRGTRSSAKRLQAARDRRDWLAAHNLCINGKGHGPATAGVLCDPCRVTHRRSA